jgi:hypothetical protein
LPDWKDARSYEPLLHAERSSFAWEWLRRQPGYRAEAPGQDSRQPQHILTAQPVQPAAERWGLHRFEDPTLSVPGARPNWRSEHHPFVLAASAEPSRASADAFGLEDLGDLATLADGPAGAHLLLSDGKRSVRLDIEGVSLLSGPVRLRYDIAGLESAKASLLVLKRLIFLASTKSFSRSLHPPDPKARRHILLLRTYDALSEKVDQRTIAAELLSARAREARWRVIAPSLRSQAQRLVQSARAMAAGGFWELLR